ncbi:MAG: sigma 54-interacting transcriptional regulator [Lachnospiraceae bacterium]|nr:sigma 54-interacting transcriptional regulator [Lachnospiraceae bacterium]
MKKVKILAIVPYEGLKDTMLEVAALREDVEVDIYVADMQKGADFVKNIENDDYEVIISRGGTAELIRNNTEIPVVEISISIYDILRGIKMVETFSKQFVIVGFRSFTGCAAVLCNLLQYNVEIYTISGEGELYDCFLHIQEKFGGRTVILCDKIANSYAQKMGFTSVLITSGSESIDTAFHEAIQISQNGRMTKALLQCLQNSLNYFQGKLLIYREDGMEVFSSDFDPEEKRWLQKIIAEYFFDFIGEKSVVYSQTHRGISYEIAMEQMEFDRKTHFNFYIKTQKKRAQKKEQSIRTLHYRDLIKARKNSFHTYISFTKDLTETMAKYAKTSEPVVLIGEPGTGKDRGAELLYEQGMFLKHPLYIVDCTQLGERQWQYLFSNENSPLYHLESTIYFRNINQGSLEKCFLLFRFLKEGEIQKKNKMIFSIALDDMPDTEEFLEILTNELSFPSLYFSALRERIQKLPELASLYINEFNAILGRQVIGFEPGAMELMKKYRWPCNLGQFKRVIKELLIVTQTPYITYDTVLGVLKKESYSGLKNQEGLYPLNLNKPLKEIENEVVRIILEEENGNQSSAARKLGISRGTLWRMLKN